MPDYSYEIAAGGVVAGVDEAGRGPLAGPVVAAAVLFDGYDRRRLPKRLRDELDDSKKLSRELREELFPIIHKHARAVGVGIAEVAEIDRYNILQATFMAMYRAVQGLGVTPDCCLIDGNRPPKLGCRTQCIVKGDSASLSIAAASVVAKVTRDRIMNDLAAEFPGYGWENNAGYGTPEHLSALKMLGVTPHHRRSFAPVAVLVNPDSVSESNLFLTLAES